MSALRQSYPMIEIVVVDDCSDILSFELLSKFCAQFSTISLYRNERALGAPSTRNTAIRHCRGEYITGLDDDDEFSQDRVKVMLEQFDPKYSFLCSNSSIILNKFGNKTIQRVPKIITIERLSYANVVGNQIFTLKSRFVEIGGYDIKMVSQQDHDMWMRMLLAFGPALGVDQVLQVVHWEDDVPRITRFSTQIRGRLRFLAKHKKHMSATGRRCYSSQLHMLRVTKLAKLRCFHKCLHSWSSRLRLRIAKVWWRSVDSYVRKS